MRTEAEFFAHYRFNDDQRQAIELTDGYVRLSAGAGSGKTLTLAGRFVYLTDYCDILPDNILCVTFTSKAATEMQKRIRKMSATGAEGSLVKTYHSFCVEVLKKHNTRLHFNTSFDIITDETMERLFRQYYKKHGFSLKNAKLKDIKTYLGKFKSYERDWYIEAMTGMNDASDDAIQQCFYQKFYAYLQTVHVHGEVAGVVATVLAEYMLYQIRNGHLDFYDLLHFTLYLFEYDDVVRSYWQDRLEYIMVDEFQDSSETELRLLTYLQGKHQNLFIVGDADQAIYGFKGGKVSLFLDFPKRFLPCHDLVLEQNYRSTKEIVLLSNALIRNNKERVDKTSNPQKDASGERVMHYHAKKDKQEMTFLADEITRLVATGAYMYKHIAVLVRSHTSKKPIEQIFVQHHVPYTIADGLKYYSRKEIQTAIAYLKMVLKNDEDAFYETVNEPARGIGESRIEALKRYANEHLCSGYEALQQLNETPLFKKTEAHRYIAAVERTRYDAKNGARVSTLLDEILRMSGYYDALRTGVNEERLEHVQQLISSIVAIEERKEEDYTLAEYIESADEFMRKAEDDEEKDEVKVMTIHSSKGLEFPVVFVPCFNEGIFPSQKSLGSIEHLEEERRLAYGMKRLPEIA